MRQCFHVLFVAAIAMFLAIGISIDPTAGQEKKKAKAKATAVKAEVELPTVESKPPPAKGPAGKTHTVSRAPFKHEIELDAILAPAQSAEVSLRPEESVQLIVKTVVPHGARVMKGQPIVRFETTKIDEQIRDLEAAKALADLSLKDARRDAELAAKTAPLDTELAERTKQNTADDLARYEKSDRAFREKSSTYNVTQVTNQLEYVEEELKQLEKMYKADDLTEETEEIVLKRAKNDVDQWKHMVDMAKYNNSRVKDVDLPRTLATYQHSAAQAALLAERAKLSGPARVEKQKLEAEKLEFEHRKASDRLARLKKDRDRLIVASPADGVLYYGRWQRGKWTNSAEVAQRLNVGAQVQPNDLILTVVQSGPLEAQAVVPEKDLAHIKTGTAAQFRPKAWPDDKVNVKFQEVANNPHTEGAFLATLTVVGSPPEKLVAGMTGKVKVTAYFKADALTVPSKAVFRDEADEDQRYVYFVGSDGKHERRPVTVGHATEALTEIASGLSAGDKILLDKPDAT